MNRGLEREIIKYISMVGANAQVTCHCGVVHFNTGESSDLKELEIKKFKNLDSKDPKEYHYHEKTIQYFVWGNEKMVFGCRCGSLSSLAENLAENHLGIFLFINNYKLIPRDSTRLGKIKLNQKNHL